MKTEAQYKLETAVEALETHVAELIVELEKLDPSAAWNSRMKVAAIEGVLEFMKGGLHDNQS